jgi:hypothetical protein
MSWAGSAATAVNTYQPPTWVQTAGTIATGVAQIASPFISAKGQQQAGADQQQAYNYNAALAESQAEEARVAGEITQQQLTQKALTLRSTQEAMYAKAGVMATGSALDVMLQSASDAEFDKSIERYNTAIDISRAKSQAANQRYYGEVSKQTAKVRAGNTLLSGIPRVLEGAGSIANTVLKPTASKTMAYRKPGLD